MRTGMLCLIQHALPRPHLPATKVTSRSVVSSKAQGLAERGYTFELRDRNPFDVHVYYSDDATRERAMVMRGRMQAAFPWMRFYSPKGRPIGPHPSPMWEADFGDASNADRWGAVVAWLEAERNGLSVLVHPHSTDGGYADHTRHAFWAGEPLKLKISQPES